MKITKLGHCALLIDLKGKRILTDPGSYTVDAQLQAVNIDYILYTHEHPDHFHLESLIKIREKNPEALIYANVSVGDLLEKEDIPYTLIQHKDIITLGEIIIEGVGEKHAIVHSSIPVGENTGFMIDKRLFYPGDALTNPDREVEILALPVAGPWLKVSEAIDYALLVKPKNAFPVHDAIRYSFTHGFFEKILKDNGIHFFPLAEGESEEFY
jgi:L-ascorbate metabolism protein UlaG (beta-lactamase superfamily)